MTIITVDWGQGAKHPYLQAVANSRLVAAKISRLIKIMEIPPKKIHIIGYSLGAHIAGYVGEDISGIKRITGIMHISDNNNFYSYLLDFGILTFNVIENQRGNIVYDKYINIYTEL
jgi:predicted alpha/beta-fold hydrolase